MSRQRGLFRITERGAFLLGVDATDGAANPFGERDRLRHRAWAYGVRYGALRRAGLRPLDTARRLP